jgi:hypothetical protein
MKRWRAAILILSAIGFAAACKSTDKDRPSGEAATGIAECDAFIARYESCVEKMPDDVRARFASSMEAQRATYRSAAAKPDSRALLTTTCKAASDNFVCP